MSGEYCCHLFRLDTHTPNLDLFVKASKYVQRAIRPIATTVTRPVKKVSCIISERILDEPRPLFFRCVDVAQRAEWRANHYLTRLPNAAETVGVVQHQSLRFR